MDSGKTYDEEMGDWRVIHIFDARTGGFIASGDIIEWKAETHFKTDMRPDGKTIFYGARFHVEDSYHNSVEVKVTAG
mgnify:CR=1 FL=1